MHLSLIAAQSADGFITRHDEPGSAFTSAADKKHFRHVLADYDCSIFGGKTYRSAREAIRQNLTPSRRRVVLTRDPTRWATEAVADMLEFTSASPAEICTRLEKAGHQRCALLGGGEIHALFLAAGLVDELILTIEPRLFGGGTPLVPGLVDVTLTLDQVERLPESDTLVLRYRIKR